MTASSLRGGVAVELVGVVHLYPAPDGDVVALRGIDLHVEPGESVALLGPSGAGKSTVLGLVAGEFAPSAGSVLVGEVNVANASAANLARMRADDLSIVMQGTESNLLPYATAKDNVWFAQQGARSRGRAVDLDVDELFQLFGLAALAETTVEALSAAERQCVALLAGVASLPRLLLVDEPTSRLAPAMRNTVIETLIEIHQQFKMTVLVVTHDPAVAVRMQRTVTIRDGRVGAEGRRGVEYSIVARDGSVHLPPETAAVLPPDSLVRVVIHSDRVELLPVVDEAAGE